VIRRTHRAFARLRDEFVFVVGLTFSDDYGSSRRRYLIHRATGLFVSKNLNSHNGTAINDAGQRVNNTHRGTAT
jgi:hypothetical protein